jgi:hypothetical protein
MEATNPRKYPRVLRCPRTFEGVGHHQTLVHRLLPNEISLTPFDANVSRVMVWAVDLDDTNGTSTNQLAEALGLPGNSISPLFPTAAQAAQDLGTTMPTAYP